VVEPAATIHIEIDLTLPLGFPSGQHLLGVEAVAVGDDGAPLHADRRIADLVVTVGSLRGLHATMDPRTVSSPRRATATVSLRNRSNTPLAVRVTAQSPGGAVKVRLQPAEVVVHPGHVVPVRARISSPRRPLARPRR